jgi:hypothetical protein
VHVISDSWYVGVCPCGCNPSCQCTAAVPRLCLIGQWSVSQSYLVLCGTVLAACHCQKVYLVRWWSLVLPRFCLEPLPALFLHNFLSTGWYPLLVPPSTSLVLLQTQSKANLSVHLTGAAVSVCLSFSEKHSLVNGTLCCKSTCRCTASSEL